MDETMPVIANPGMPVAAEADEYTAIFKPHISAALKATLRIMKNSPDETTVLKAADSIMDRGGATRKVERSSRPVINITDSNVQLLIQAQKESS